MKVESKIYYDGKARVIHCNVVVFTFVFSDDNEKIVMGSMSVDDEGKVEISFRDGNNVITIFRKNGKININSDMKVMENDNTD